jgi:hypothetical protein
LASNRPFLQFLGEFNDDRRITFLPHLVPDISGKFDRAKRLEPRAMVFLAIQKVAEIPGCGHTQIRVE